MSNLKLPEMSWKNLNALLPTTLNAGSTTLAYATTARRSAINDAILIEHHGNVIASIQPFFVHITNCGWGSFTTRTRLHQILVDNNIEWNVSQKDFVQILRPRLVGRSVPTLSGFYSADFVMKAGLWELEQFNGEEAA